jgi:hypothetical protein
VGRGRRKGCKNGVASCNGNSCMKCGDDKRAARNARSTWTPAGSQNPDVGVVEGTDEAVSFKTGGPSGDETLIADGDYSDDNNGFAGPRGNRNHDHHGPTRSTDRGKYTGPGH